jgi:predicted NodU family carbamoyl transferase
VRVFSVFIKFERLLEIYLSYAPHGIKYFLAAMPVWLKEKLFLKETLKRELEGTAGCKPAQLPPLLFNDHHLSHAGPSTPARSQKPTCRAWTGPENGAAAPEGNVRGGFLQVVNEEIVLKRARTVRRETDAKYLWLAGGVALNCVANDELLRKNVFNDIWVQRAAGDAGGAFGALLAASASGICI